MDIIPLTPEDEAFRQQLGATVRRLQEADICPTCRNFESGDVYPPAEDRTFYEDALVLCLLEAYPRNLGHTIMLLKAHYEDLTHLPPEVTAQVYGRLHATIETLKRILSPEKIYLCSMCDGSRNHLHYQLIPRFGNDQIQGSRLFIKTRGRLVAYESIIPRLRAEMVAVVRQMAP